MRKLISFLVVLLFASSVHAEMTERQKITSLLDMLANSDIIFIRNGEEHDAQWAYAHLSDKLKDTKGVKTAGDFIIKVASKSSHTDQYYMIKLEDGTEIKSIDWFRERLKEINDENTEEKDD